MAVRNRPHISILAPANSEPYSPVGQGRQGASPPSPSDRRTHGYRLQQELETANTEATDRHRVATPLQVEGSIEGIYIKFESVPGFELSLQSLEPQQGRCHPELRAVNTYNVGAHEIQTATVFVPDGWIVKFAERFEQYALEDTPNGNPRNKQLVERISKLRLATLRALWTDHPADYPDQTALVWWEVWLRRRDGEENRFARFAEAKGLRFGNRRLVFEDRIVLLVYGSASQLSSALDVLDDLAELRKPAEATQFLSDLPAAEQAGFVQELSDRIKPPNAEHPAVCILDTGVARGHPLLRQSIDRSDCHSCDPSWGTDDRNGHGTQMAGLALYGNVGQALLSSGDFPLAHCLESVKILGSSL